jgi:hypothetical protein
MERKNNLKGADLDIVIAHTRDFTSLSKIVSAHANTNNSSVANINEALIEIMVGFKPDELEVEYFVEATLSLDGHDFARAVYRTYLKRELEDPKLRIDGGAASRTEFVNRVKSSREYANRKNENKKQYKNTNNPVFF